MTFKDGDPLPGGKVISLKGGYCVAVYRCACGREQAARYEGFGYGGLSEDGAQSVGWRCNGRWVCPTCSDRFDGEWALDA